MISASRVGQARDVRAQLAVVIRLDGAMDLLGALGHVRPPWEAALNVRRKVVTRPLGRELASVLRFGSSCFDTVRSSLNMASCTCSVNALCWRADPRPTHLESAAMC